MPQEFKSLRKTRHHRPEAFARKYGEVAGKFIYKFITAHPRRHLPWQQAFKNIYNRCSRKWDSRWKNYGAVGIKCRISAVQLKKLFFKDKAYLMKQPSIDRKDSLKDYTIGNCEWIEFEENRKKRLWSEEIKIGQMLEIKSGIDKKIKKFNWPKRILSSFIRRLAREYDINTVKSGTISIQETPSAIPIHRKDPKVKI